MTDFYGPPETLPRRRVNVIRRNKAFKPRYLAQRIGAIMRLPVDHVDIDYWTLQLDHEALHIIHQPVDDIGLPVTVISLPYQVWEEFVRWYGKGWWEK